MQQVKSGGSMKWKVWKDYRWYYSWPAIWCKRTWLWLRIVGRTNQGDYRIGPKLAWEIVCCIWDATDHISRTREAQC